MRPCIKAGTRMPPVRRLRPTAPPCPSPPRPPRPPRHAPHALPRQIGAALSSEDARLRLPRFMDGRPKDPEETKKELIARIAAVCGGGLPRLGLGPSFGDGGVWAGRAPQERQGAAVAQAQGAAGPPRRACCIERRRRGRRYAAGPLAA
jgi:hypothetical protein